MVLVIVARNAQPTKRNMLSEACVCANCIACILLCAIATEAKVQAKNLEIVLVCEASQA